MKINRLKLTNFRAFEQAEFEFQPGMNLVVGINGVGKSTVLDALCIALSRVLPDFTVCHAKLLDFHADDIMVGHDTLDVEINFQASEIPFQCNVSKRKKKNHQVKLLPDNWQIQNRIKTKENQPLVLYFATRRSIVTKNKSQSNPRTEFTQNLAFYDALIPRMLRLEEFTDWWVAQEKLVNENSKLAQRNLNILNDAVTRFLDWCTNVRVIDISEKSEKSENSEKLTIAVDKDGRTLKINQLSDGERGILALVLELIKRLLLANPGLEDPVKDGEAVVLIDELDLHLHPSWQRKIVQKLTDIFPNCQFIATTHSPQIIGEVKPNGLTLLQKKYDQGVIMQKGGQSFGLDSSWILKHLMDTEPRNRTVQNQIDSIEDSLEDGDLELARHQIDKLKDIIDDDEVCRLEASINNLEALADEIYSEK